ncbi:hypothetical protein ACLB1G_08820 [Oxalobacteraceae bacterium A2-2]
MPSWQATAGCAFCLSVAVCTVQLSLTVKVTCMVVLAFFPAAWASMGKETTATARVKAIFFIFDTHCLSA